MNKGVSQPLVSVSVVTYNSASTVIETLDSIYNQTYPNIELIVSDDCSLDNTVEIVRDWLSAHQDRFARVEILTAEKNQGISANCNKAGAACTADWNKGIAGDDMLMPSCIEEFMSFVDEHPDATYIFSRVKPFGASTEAIAHYESVFDYSFFCLSPEEQYDRLTLRGNCIPAPGVFANVARARAIGIKNDERIPMLEDWPKWINLIKKGVPLYFIDKELVLYRANGGISTNSPSPAFARALSLVYKYYCFSNRFKKGNKISAIYDYLDAEVCISNNAVHWRVLSYIWKKMTALLYRIGIES